MPACKVCGSWFVKIKPHEELCDKCECALYRLSGYVARVTRCKDCKHCDPENHHCDHPMSTSAPLSRKPDDFCSYGERKDDADV